MPAVSYQQTDTAAPAGTIQACSATAVGPGTAFARLASAGGTAGSTPLTVGGNSFDSGQTQSLIMFETTPAAGVDWAAGNYVVRVNVTTAAASVTWAATYVCRLNSANVNQASIGSLTGQTTSMATTGVKTHTVSGAAQTPAAGDKVYVVCVLTAAANNRSIAFTPDQLIDTPVNVPFAVSVSDSHGAADAYDRLSDALRQFADSAGLSDDAALVLVSGALLTIAASENLGLSDPALSRTAYLEHELPAELVATLDAFDRLSDGLRGYSDDLGATDAFDRLSDGNRSYADDLAGSDAFDRLSDGLREYSDSAGTFDAFDRLADALRDFTDAMGLADDAALVLVGEGAALELAASELLGLSDPALSKTALVEHELPAELAALADDAALVLLSGFLTLAVAENLGTADAFARLADALRSYAESAGFSDPAIETTEVVDLLLGAEGLGLADAASLALVSAGTFLIAVAESLGLFDQFARVADASRAESENLGASDSFARLSDALREFSELLGLSDDPTLLLVGAGVFALVVADSLGTSDAFARLADASRAESESLGAADDFARIADALRAYSDGLALSDAAALLLVGAGVQVVLVAELLGALDAFDRRADANRLVEDAAGLLEALDAAWGVVALLSGLGAYYRLDGNLRDSSGNERHLSGTATYAAAVLNRGLSTGGGSRAAAWPATQLQATSASVAGWFYAGGVGGVDALGAKAGWANFYAQYRTGSSPKRFFRARVGVFDYDTAAVAEGWHHVAVVWEIHGGGNHVHVYLDGAIAVTHDDDGSIGGFGDIVLDADADFASALDEVALYDRALDDVEVAELAGVLDPTVVLDAGVQRSAVCGVIDRTDLCGVVSRVATCAGY